MIGPFLKSAAAMPQPVACEEEDELRRYMAGASGSRIMSDVATIARMTAALDSIANARRNLSAAECQALAREALGVSAIDAKLA